MTPPSSARDLRVTGVVQGVGFRPFVHRMALRQGLAGWVRNVAGTVEIHVEGAADALDRFQRDLRLEAPPVARIDTLEAASGTLVGFRGFDIAASEDADGNRPVPPDVATCASCERELFDPADRRYRHPFITCTDCGPRYTVIEALPYDRERTTLGAFEPCPSCAGEYGTPGARRHHAESLACHECGPQLWLESLDGRRWAYNETAVQLAALSLRRGAILAVRGVGGFHLACDATNDVAVRRLRDRKHREAKPLAVMVRTLEAARAIAEVADAEAALLTGPERPIVLLRRRAHAARGGASLATGLAPGLDRVGVMLAYAPLHHLLLEGAGVPLVMTSGNLSDEPIAIGNAEARARLGQIADEFLLHDREILSRVDDSVARVVDGAPLLMRRARGYAPLALRLPVPAPRPLAAVGPHLKNTFTLARDGWAWPSPHIGDLESLDAVAHWKTALARYRDLFRIAPEVAVRDLHPGYLSTRLAEELGLERTIAVQHHHAHVAAVAAEHGVTSTVVGLAFDGTGYGDDGAVWGAETLVADLRGYRRVAQLRYAPLPGGDLAAREPWRAALGYLSLEPGAEASFALAFDGVSENERRIAERQVARGLNAPLASSMGRLFDAAAAVLGVRHRSGFEGQAAAELESLAGERVAHAVAMPVREADGRWVIDPVPMLAELGARRIAGEDVHALAASFHESVALAAAAIAARAAEAHGADTVALGGGSFQNARLLSGVRRRLASCGLRVLVPRLLSPNDGAISYGQAAVAAAVLASE
ncbi:MAG: carbamoyltransferase HypF [Gemmatimonadetes bacterium]|nr:carbamoyltransferase HypF [Gemmatimonadota bacterium]